MTAVMTNPRINDAMMKRLHDEAVGEMEVSRANAITELNELESELAEIVPALDEAEQNAVRDLNMAIAARDEAVAKARAAVLSAQRATRSAVGPVEHEIERLRSLLENDLQHPSIASALETVEQLRESMRSLGGMEREQIAETQAKLQRCIVARESLVALQHRVVNDVPKEVAAILRACGI